MVDAGSSWHLTFEGGTVCLRRGESRRSEAPPGDCPPGCRWDPRSASYRAPAVHYADIVRFLQARKQRYEDGARAYGKLESSHAVRHAPFPYQREALSAWQQHRRRGVVVLPTGSGKTFLATMAMDATRRSTLVVVPTLDLMHQWYDVLLAAFPQPIGLIGGGYYEPTEITVTTYDSAHLHMDRLGDRYGLVIFDECHHLPSEAYAAAARCSLAPFRLGLTATPERMDGGEELYQELIGEVAYRRDIDELSGDYLADYETHRITVELTAAEREEYEQERARYTAFLRQAGIAMSSPSGWNDFIIKSSRTAEGRRAFVAYRRQRALALAAEAKLDVLDRLLHAHRRDRTLVFTEDNATVYRIAERFLVPAITHQTKVKERTEILQAFNAGSFGAVVTSKVLNEGVNVPEANVAVVLSGSGSVREHVQRLGRILRKRKDKRAVLYELVAADTAEVRVSAKRRDHRAYR
jgi:superfamily II DNA or RNA helicase